MPSMCLMHLLLLGCREAYLMVVRRGIWDDTELLSKTLQINSYTAMLLRFSSLTEKVTVYLSYLLVHSGKYNSYFMWDQIITSDAVFNIRTWTIL